MRKTTTDVTEVRVWDPFIRFFHWSLASAVLIAWATDEPLWLHTWLGYIAAILVLLRLIVALRLSAQPTSSSNPAIHVANGSNCKLA